MTCRYCGYEGEGNYCAACGHPFMVKRITVSSIFHEVIHIFIHFEKGFGHTLKELATHPGRMQKDYLLGKRSEHQQPFSTFFLCATISGLAIYWISIPSHHATEGSFMAMREHFYRHYFVILQSILVPFYTLTTWLLFRSRNFNYAEALVLLVYGLAFSLLLVILTNAIDLVPHHFETWYIEIPLLAGYMIWTNLNFFNTQSRWLVILKSLVNIVISWLVSNWITDRVIEWMR